VLQWSFAAHKIGSKPESAWHFLVKEAMLSWKELKEQVKEEQKRNPRKPFTLTAFHKISIVLITLFSTYLVVYKPVAPVAALLRLQASVFGGEYHPWASVVIVSACLNAVFFFVLSWFRK